MRNRIIQLALAAFLGGLVSSAISQAKPIRLPPPKPPTINGRRPLAASTLPSGQPIGTATTVDWDSHCIRRDGSASWVLKYFDASNNEIFRKNLVVDAACTIVTDPLRGATVANPPPASLCTSLTTEVTQTTALVNNCVTANKCNP